MSPIAILFIFLIIGALVGFLIPGEGRDIGKGWYTLSVPWGDDGDGDGDETLTCDGANQQKNEAGDACECIEGFFFR